MLGGEAGCAYMPHVIGKAVDACAMEGGNGKEGGAVEALERVRWSGIGLVPDDGTAGGPEFIEKRCLKRKCGGQFSGGRGEVPHGASVKDKNAALGGFRQLPAPAHPLELHDVIGVGT